MKNTIEINDLVKKWPGTGFSLNVPRLVVPAGKSCAVVGPNGSGKTTLLRLLCSLEKPDSGSILLAGHNLSTAAGRKLARRETTFLTHPPAMFTTSVYRNVAFAAVRSAARAADGNREVARALAAAGLERFEKRNAAKLSSGEKQRVAIARALAFRPKLLLMDEPTANIDRENALLIENVLQSLRRSNASIVFSTLSREQAFRLGDEIVSLNNGDMEIGYPENFFTAAFFERNGESFARIAADIEISIPHTHGCRGAISINPERITLSPLPPPAAPRNLLNGRITRLEEARGCLIVTVSAGADFVAAVEPRTWNTSGLSLGATCCIAFEPSSVKVRTH
ncbi:MAG: ATP-binding cassette domain-containing protein [bacterium]